MKYYIIGFIVLALLVSGAFIESKIHIFSDCITVLESHRDTLWLPSKPVATPADTVWLKPDSSYYASKDTNINGSPFHVGITLDNYPVNPIFDWSFNYPVIRDSIIIERYSKLRWQVRLGTRLNLSNDKWYNSFYGQINYNIISSKHFDFRLGIGVETDLKKYIPEARAEIEVKF